MAFGLAVYASQDGLPRHHARLASGRWSGATGRASHPQDSDERFQSCLFTSHPPFPSFAWHNVHDRGRKQQIAKCIRWHRPPRLSCTAGAGQKTLGIRHSLSPVRTRSGRGAPAHEFLGHSGGCRKTGAVDFSGADSRVIRGKIMPPTGSVSAGSFFEAPCTQPLDGTFQRKTRRATNSAVFSTYLYGLTAFAAHRSNPTPTTPKWRELAGHERPRRHRGCVSVHSAVSLSSCRTSPWTSW